MKTLEGDGCLSVRCYPPNWSKEDEVVRTPSSKPAKTYPFKLDPFQREAVSCLGEYVCMRDVLNYLRVALADLMCV